MGKKVNISLYEERREVQKDSCDSFKETPYCIHCYL
jgi:hypothetical protein